MNEEEAVGVGFMFGVILTLGAVFGVCWITGYTVTKAKAKRQPTMTLRGVLSSAEDTGKGYYVLKFDDGPEIRANGNIPFYLGKYQEITFEKKEGGQPHLLVKSYCPGYEDQADQQLELALGAGQ